VLSASEPISQQGNAIAISIGNLDPLASKSVVITFSIGALSGLLANIDGGAGIWGVAGVSQIGGGI
jgi:hypothetical protein